MMTGALRPTPNPSISVMAKEKDPIEAPAASAVRRVGVHQGHRATVNGIPKTKVPVVLVGVQPLADSQRIR